MSGILGGLIGSFATASTTSYESIATTTLGSAASSITFSSIPSTFKHLQIRVLARSSRSDQIGSFSNMTFNSDTSANYFWHFMNGNGSSTQAIAGTSRSAVEVNRYATASDSSNVFGVIVIDILDYQNLNKNKTVRYLGGFDNNGSGEIYFGSGAWNNSSTAISSITLTEGSGNLVQYSQAALYGIKG